MKLPVHTCSEERREHSERKCKEAGVSGRAGMIRCIIDVCYKMKATLEVERELNKLKLKLHDIKKPQIVTPVAKPTKPGVCYSLGDPHYKTFTGKRYNNYWYGDWVLVKSKGFTVHARTKKYNRAAVNKKFVAKLNGDTIEASYADKFILNGNNEIDLKIGQKFRLPNGGVVHRTARNRAVYYSFERGYLDAEFLGSGSMKYINLIVNVPNYDETTGACQGNMIAAHGLFHTEHMIVKEHKEMKITKKCHEDARRRCRSRGIRDKELMTCVFDVCAGLGTEGMRKGARHERQNR